MSAYLSPSVAARERRRLRGNGRDRVLAEHRRGFQAQNRANTLSTGKHAIPHRFMDRRGMSLFLREQAVERLLDSCAV